MSGPPSQSSGTHNAKTRLSGLTSDGLLCQKCLSRLDLSEGLKPPQHLPEDPEAPLISVKVETGDFPTVLTMRWMVNVQQLLAEGTVDRMRLLLNLLDRVARREAQRQPQADLLVQYVDSLKESLESTVGKMKEARGRLLDKTLDYLGPLEDHVSQEVEKAVGNVQLLKRLLQRLHRGQPVVDYTTHRNAQILLQECRLPVLTAEMTIAGKLLKMLKPMHCFDSVKHGRGVVMSGGTAKRRREDKQGGGGDGVLVSCLPMLQAHLYQVKIIKIARGRSVVFGVQNVLPKASDAPDPFFCKNDHRISLRYSGNAELIVFNDEPRKLGELSKLTFATPTMTLGLLIDSQERLHMYREGRDLGYVTTLLPSQPYYFAFDLTSYCLEVEALPVKKTNSTNNSELK